MGGALGKLAAKYGAPWRWKKLANLATRTKGLLGDLMEGVKGFFKASKCAHSFAAGTLVLMADGTTKPIEKVKPGEKVLATDPITGKTTAQVVVATHINLDAELTDLSIATAGGHALVQTTAHHPFWSQDRSTWVNATDLRAGENLRAPTGEPLAVSAIESYTSSRVMYDLTIDNTHTYYVMAGSTPVLVHNCNIAPAGHDYRGGLYDELKDPATGNNVHGTEINHMPPNSINGLPRGRGPSIQMDKADHYKTASWGSSRAAKRHRAQQRAMLDSGDSAGAVMMDINDVRGKFGTKYDGAILEMLESWGR